MIYFDNGATSRFKPPQLAPLMQELAYNSSNAGRSGHSDTLALGKRIYGARQNLLNYCHASDDYEAIYTSGCTESLNLAIFGYFDKKDSPSHVITTLNEHNSVLRPLHKLQAMGKITVTYLAPNKDGTVTADMIASSLCHNTAMIIINHTSNVTGATADLFDIGKLCHDKNIVFVVDGAQSLGHTPIDVEACHIDMLCGAGHKGLHGLQGIGFLVAHRDIQLSPLKYGGTGTASESAEQPQLMPEGYESGTLNAFGVLALDCGIQWTSKNQEILRQKYRRLSSELFYGLRHVKDLEIYSQYPSTVVSLNVKDYTSSDIADYLNDKGIAVRPGLHCAPFIHSHLGTLERGAVRISLGNNNTLNDVNILLYHLEQLAKIK